MLAFGPRLRRLKALTGFHQPAFMPPLGRRQIRRQFLPPRHLCADSHRHRHYLDVERTRGIHTQSTHYEEAYTYEISPGRNAAD